MVDIYFPEVNKSSDHVSGFFDRSPARTSDVLYEEAASQFRFGYDALSAIATNIAPSGDFFTAEEWRASKYFREGVEISESGVYESVAESLATASDRRFRRDLTLSNARRGFGLGAARFGASMVGAIGDPLNIGLSILAPVALGYSAAARAASASVQAGVRARAGVTAGRVAAGAGEATVGALAFEPIALIGADLQQDPDYGLFDSFVNLTAGAILGGAVGGIAGKFKDRRTAALETASVISRSDPQTVLESLRVAIAQTEQGLPVRVDAIQNADPNIGPAARAEAEVKKKRAETRKVNFVTPKADEVPDLLKRAYLIDPATKTTKTPKTLTQFVKDNGRIATESILQGELKSRLDQGSFGVRASRAKGGIDIDEMALRAQEAGYFEVGPDVERITPEQLVGALEADGGFGNKVFSRLDDDVQAYEDAVAYDEIAYTLNIDPRGMTDAEFLQEIEIRANALTQEEALQNEVSKGPGISKQEFDDEIARVQAALLEQGDLEEFVSAAEEMAEFGQAYDGRVSSQDARIVAADRDIQELQTQITALRANNLLTDEEIAGIAEYDELINRADEYQSIVEAGAACVINRRNG